jgi:electron transfer flavoprotein beta subunit
MKILVPLKRVPDYQVKVKVKADKSGIETDGIKWVINPFDEIAVEEAIRLKEKGIATEIVVATLGPSDASAQLRSALALGADRAIHVVYGGALDSDIAARVFEAVYRRGEYGLVIMGKQGVDSDASQGAQLLAARLKLPQACFASKVEIADGKATVTREVDGGLDTIRVTLPAIISTDLRLNEPRYASLFGVKAAKNKPLEEIPFETLGIAAEVKVRVISMTPPPKRQAGKKVGSVTELVAALQNEAKVL